MNIFLGLILLFTLGCTNTSPHNNKNSNNENSHTHKKFAKTRGFVNVSIDERSRDNDFLYLEATIHPNKNMPGSTAEWKVPDHVKVSEGSLEESIDLHIGTKVTYQLVINKDSLLDGDKIFFFAYQMQNGERMGSSINYLYKEKNSNNQIEAQSLEKIKIQKEKLIQ